jgi:hypothetical protein
VLGGGQLVRVAARVRVDAYKARIADNAQITPDASGFFQASPEEAGEMDRRGETSEERSARERIRPFIDPVVQFESRHINSVPTLEEAETMLRPIEQLLAVLESTGEPELPEKLKNTLIASLALACSKIATVPTLDCGTDLGKAVTRVLLLAATNRYPEAKPDELAEFDKGEGIGGWGYSRVAAAEGLLALASKTRCTDAPVIERLDVLVKDRSAHVRYRIANHACEIRSTQPDKMWEWIELLAKDESINVRKACVHSLDRLANLAATRSMSLMTQILDDVPSNREGSDSLARKTVKAFAGWYVVRNEPTAKAALENLIANIRNRAKQALSLPAVLRDLLTQGDMDDSGTPSIVRGRAIELLKSLSSQSCNIVRDLLDGDGQTQSTSGDEEPVIQSLLN